MADNWEELRAQARKELEMEDLLQRARDDLVSEQIVPRGTSAIPDTNVPRGTGSITEDNVIQDVPRGTNPVINNDEQEQLLIKARNELKTEEPGIMQRLKTGAGKGVDTHQRRIRILNSLLNGQVPEVEQVEQSPKLSWKPGDIAEFAGRVGTEMVPSIAATSAGASAGMAGGPYGAAAGAAGMGALFAGGEAYADAYNNARLAGKTDQEARDFAKKSSTAAGLFAGALGPAGRFGAKDALIKYISKQIGVNVTAAEAENIVQNAIAREIDPERALTEGWKETGVAAGATGAIPGLAGRAAEPPHIAGSRKTPPARENLLGGPSEPPHNKPPAAAKPHETVVEGQIIPRPEEVKAPFIVPEAQPNAPVPRGTITEQNQNVPRGTETEEPIWQQKALTAVEQKLADVANRRASLEDAIANGELSADLIPQAQERINELVQQENAARETIKLMREDIDILAKAKASKANAEKNKPPVSPPPKEEGNVPRGTDKNLPVPYEKPKTDIEVAKQKRQEKVVEGTILHPDVERTKAKIFSNGDMSNPVEQGILNKAAKGISDYWSHRPLETAMFDWKAPLKQEGAKAAGKNSITMRESANVPYRTAAATTHMGGIINAVLEHGTPYLNKKDSLVELKPNSKGLMPILRPAFTSEQKASDFKAYMYGRRVENQGLIEKGKEQNITAPEASELVALGEKNPEFKDMFRDIQNHKESILDLMEDAGLINKKQRASWDGIDHIPFTRDMGEKGEFKQAKGTIVGQKPNIHELTGGKRQYLVFDKDSNPIFRTTSIRQAYNERKRLGAGATIEDVGPVTKDLYENLIQNENYLVASSVRNIAARENIKAALKNGIAKRVSTNSVAERKRDGELIVSVFDGGREKFYQVTDMPFYKALTSTQFKSTENLNATQKVLRASKKFLTANIMGDVGTVVNVGLKDFARTLMISKDKIGLKGLIKTMPKNYFASILHETGIKLDPRIIDIMAGGGGSGYFRNKADEKVRQLSDEAKKADGTYISPAWYKQIISAPYDKARKVVRGTGNAVDNAHRLTIFDSVIQSGGSKAEAIFEASDLMDYAMHGQSGLIRELIEDVPFLKTLLQSIHKLGRTVSHNYGWNRTTKNLLALGTMAALNTLINLIPDDDEELAANGYEAQPEWKLNNYVMVDMYKYLGMGSSKAGEKIAKERGYSRWLQIQKPWAEGFLALTVPERITRAFGKDADYAKEMWQLGQAGLDQLYLNPLPPLFKEVAEQTAGYDFYSGNKIVPESRKNLEPHLQFNQNTSKTAKNIGEAFNISPARIDHAIKGLGGTIATYVSLIPDALDNNVNAKKDWTETYFIKKHLGGELAKDNAFVNELYNVSHQIQVAKNTLEEYEATDQEAKIEKTEKEKGYLIDMEKDMANYKKSIKEIQDDILEVKSDKELNAKEKQTQINELIRERNMILHDMHQMIKEEKMAAKEEKMANKKGK